MNEVLRDAGGKLPLIESEVLPGDFSHAFTTRSASPDGGAFNLAVGWAPEGAERQVLEDRARLLGALGADKLFVATQVHGSAVARVTAGDRPEEVAALRVDGLITDVPGFAVAVFTADCVPVLIADAVSGACAAVHAGWRGVVAEVVSTAVKELASAYGARPEDLRVALGPSIGPCCFEVGPEVVAEFAKIGASASARAGGKAHLDLRRVLRGQLEKLGVARAHIDEGGECTKCDPAGRFFSFRRDGRAGQQMALIVRNVVGAAAT